MVDIHYGSALHVYGLAIDASRKTDAKSLAITHAHSDHVNLSSPGKSYMTGETLALVNARYGSPKNPSARPLGKKINSEAKFSFLNSGHILGSAMVLVEGEKTALVTSDFKTTDSIVTKAAQPEQCDILVIESTYGKPEYVFPGRQETYNEMEKWAKKCLAENRLVVLCGYSLGKAQELTKFSNEFLGIEPLVHESVFKMNNVYSEYGSKIGNYILMDHNLKESGVLILPPTLAGKHLFSALEFSTGKKISSAIASGFNAPGFSRSFPLSDHACFPELMEFIESCAPEMVYTFHGFEEELARNVTRKLGIPAKPLNSVVKGQSVLQEF